MKNVLVVFAFVPLLYVAGVFLIPGFGSWQSLVSLLVIASFLGIASIGQTVTVILGGIDLSIPAIIGLANVLAVKWYGAGLPFPLVVLAILVIAALIGALNGGLSRVFGAHPLLVTLGMSFIVLGAVLVYTEGRTIGTIPKYLMDAVSPAGRTGPIPLPLIVILWFALAAVAILVEQRTYMGRQLFAAGANERAARLTFVPLDSIWIVAYSASAVCAAIAGILLAGFSGGADANVGKLYLFQTVAAVVVGGTSLLGGSGGSMRTLAGVIIITLLTTIFIGLGFNERLQQVALGILIIALVAAYGREASVRTQI